MAAASNRSKVNERNEGRWVKSHPSQLRAHAFSPDRVDVWHGAWSMEDRSRTRCKRSPKKGPAYFSSARSCLDCLHLPGVAGSSSAKGRAQLASGTMLLRMSNLHLWNCTSISFLLEALAVSGRPRQHDSTQGPWLSAPQSVLAANP